jgi:DNA-binding protein HU-beta
VNKGEFAAVLAERTELSQAAAHRALDGILDTLTEVMVDRDEVSFSGWGKFSAQRRKGREAHDPRDPSRTIHVAPGYVPKFKAGAVLKREIHAAQPADVQESDAARPAPRAEARDSAGRNDRSAATRDAEKNGRGGQDRLPGRWRPLAER